MRRKLGPQALERATNTRALLPARTASRLPTAAALAFALSSMACASRADDVTADPVAIHAAPVVTVSASATPPGTNPPIEPEPHALAGEPAIVAPVPSVTAPVPSVTAPVPSVTAPKHVPAVVPSSRPHRTAGIPMRVTPTPTGGSGKGSPHDPF